MSRPSVAKRAGRAALVLGIAAIAVKVSVVGCDDAGSYIFSGEQYDPVLQCLEPVASIDVIAGNEPGSCGPACILSLPQDGGQIAYVSTMCGPYPTYPFESDASTNPLCVAAMNAFTRGALCEDGGVVITGDAGTDAAAGDATPGDSASPSDTGAPPSDSAATSDGADDASPAAPDASEPIDASASDASSD